MLNLIICFQQNAADSVLRAWLSPLQGGAAYCQGAQPRPGTQVGGPAPRGALEA